MVKVKFLKGIPKRAPPPLCLWVCPGFGFVFYRFGFKLTLGFYRVWVWGL